MHKTILEEIQKADIITIFRHQLADSDAMGSQLGLATWIRETYPEKQVYCCGMMSPVSSKFVDHLDEVSDETIASSLAILLDTSNLARVSDSRFSLAKHSIRIDHHVKIEEICDIEWIDEKASATCEMVPLLFKENDIKISARAAQYFYCGLIADNIRFSIASVRKETFEVAAYLIECGVDVLKANELNFSISLSDYQYETKVRNQSQVMNKCMYAIMEREDYQSCGQTYENAKDKVYCLSGIQEIEIWALFTKMKDSELYACSLRSKTKNVRDIASSFGGGGHVCACGIKNITIEQVHEIIDCISKRSIEN
ncbi:DHH family phosphoesterase [Floccifex sp.]|uniref:DHH family phosphoesterase n=1 Tax=Floccifex sp. TaxID=2815810 RepID=UPI002A74B6B4|nr:bifunctional oligoribonuclease/PAP phosphatase NrnA [Floccifex sp.]MDD7281422.1 bifunctional oligoribonuclease/PAP phosphatase NrnA [Erysipelotrichaceae bacterium]MDY2957802.1 bifunctional oligoribonuclease/PAP phosphatase NrnA [Floccifex sp.]